MSINWSKILDGAKVVGLGALVVGGVVAIGAAEVARQEEKQKEIDSVCRKFKNGQITQSYMQSELNRIEREYKSILDDSPEPIVIHKTTVIDNRPHLEDIFFGSGNMSSKERKIEALTTIYNNDYAGLTRQAEAYRAKGWNMSAETCESQKRDLSREFKRDLSRI